MIETIWQLAIESLDTKTLHVIEYHPKQYFQQQGLFDTISRLFLRQITVQLGYSDHGYNKFMSIKNKMF